MSKSFEVAVIGAGPAGSVASLVLARQGRSVIMLDSLEGPKRKVGESLPSAARPILKHLGLLPLADNGIHLISHGNNSAWGSTEIQTTDYIRDPNGPGWHLDRPRFDESNGSSMRREEAVLSPNASARAGVKTVNSWPSRRG
jgi:flavin-dependent dehydrogenase